MTTTHATTPDQALRAAERAGDVAQLAVERARAGLCEAHGAAPTSCPTCVAAAVCEAVLGAARGSYQEALIRGRQRWSGADLRGNAGKYGASYARSRSGLLDRVAAALLALDVDGSWRFGTRIDSARHGQRRAVLIYVHATGELALDWDDLTETDLAQAIANHPAAIA